jgi:uroporphyrinogen-III synthase
MTRVLVLRPEPGASATVKRARERGLDSVALPLFEMEPVAWEAPQASGFDGLLLTSANAVRWGGERLKDLRALPAYAVGEATAQAARDFGFDVAATGDGGIDRLLGSINPELKLLHLAGADLKLPDKPRQEIRSIAVYRAKAIDGVDLGDAAGSIALIHSPRAARRFAELMALDKASVTIAAISRDAADAAGAGWARVDVAEAPNDEALLALTERLCNKAPAR